MAIAYFFFGLSLLSGIGCGFIGQSTSQGKDVQLESLRGLDGIYVRPEPLLPGVVDFDLYGRLRTAGIPLLSKQEKKADSPNFSIIVNSQSDSDGWYLYTLRFELHQAVYLKRDSSFYTMAATWRSRGSSSPGTYNILVKKEALQMALEGAVNQFIEDYQSVNLR